MDVPIGDYRLCWCGSEVCNATSDYPMDVGRLRLVHGSRQMIAGGVSPAQTFFDERAVRGLGLGGVPGR